MIEILATSIITVSSALLFGYWFRYTCLLILSTKTSKDYAGEVAVANQLSFPGVQLQLQHAASADLDRLMASLDRDYDLLMFLVRNSSNVSHDNSLEDKMLQLNYRVMSTWYRVSRNFSPKWARNALEEMSMVVAHFANAMGERAAVPSAA